MSNKDIGKTGEKIASEYLRKKGYRIVETNFYTRWGEIDIVAITDNKLSFIEVKTRTSTKYGKPYEAVNQRKILNLMRPINHFLLKKKYKNYKLSLDVISILLSSENKVVEIKHYENIYK